MQQISEDENIAIIQKNIEKIHDLLTHSLKLAEIGLVIDKKGEVDITKPLHDCKQNYKGIEFVISNPLLILLGDREKISQIFTNIITNGIIHGNATQIVFKSETKDDRFLMLGITNNGKPIDLKIKDIIFNRGFTTSKEDNGLGLYIVQKIVTSHGWQIKLTDLENVTFTIIIPLIDVRF